MGVRSEVHRHRRPVSSFHLSRARALSRASETGRSVHPRTPSSPSVPPSSGAANVAAASSASAPQNATWAKPSAGFMVLPEAQGVDVAEKHTCPVHADVHPRKPMTSPGPHSSGSRSRTSVLRHRSAVVDPRSQHGQVPTSGYATYCQRRAPRTSKSRHRPLRRSAGLGGRVPPEPAGPPAGRQDRQIGSVHRKPPRIRRLSRPGCHGALSLAGGQSRTASEASGPLTTKSISARYVGGHCGVFNTQGSRIDVRRRLSPLHSPR